MSNKYFNERRAVQAGAIFTKLEGGIIDKYKLCKQMYYLERQTIIQTGQPLFHGYLCSLPLGPVISEVNDGVDAIIPPNNIKENVQRILYPDWEDHFSPAGRYKLRLDKDPGDDELSPADLNQIKEIYEKFKGWGFNKLKNFFENLPEHTLTKSQVPIAFADILRVTGSSEEEINELREEYYYYLEVLNI